MTVVVDVAAALICFASQCYPALVGPETPRGQFSLTPYTIEDPRYGGDLLVFKHGDGAVYAVHRVIDVPGQQRLARLRSPHAQHRITVTAGCVNVDPEVYRLLYDCCSRGTIEIK